MAGPAQGMTKALTFDMELILSYLQPKASDFFDVDFLDDYRPAAVETMPVVRTLAEAFQSVDTRKMLPRPCSIPAAFSMSWVSMRVRIRLRAGLRS